MLGKGEWKEAAPQVPEEFHRKLEDTLMEIEGGRKIRMKKRRGMKVLLVAAAIVVVGTGAAFAADVFSWNPVMVEKFQPSQEEQSALALDQVSQQIGQSVTDAGVTMTLEQTLEDPHNLYMLFEVETPENIELTEWTLFEQGLYVTVDGDPAFDGGGNMGATGSFVDGQTDAHRRSYEIWIHYSEEISWEGKEIGIKFVDLADSNGIKAPAEGQSEVVAKGEWDFTWTASGADSTLRYDINQTYDLGGYPVEVKRLELTPFSYTIVTDAADALAVDEDEKNRMEYNGPDPGMDILSRLVVDSIIMKDGTVITDAYGGPGSGGVREEDPNEYSCSIGMGKVIDWSQAESILFCQGQTEIVLPGLDTVEDISEEELAKDVPVQDAAQ